MAAARRPTGSLQTRLAAVQALRELETVPELLAALRRALVDPSEHVVSHAAALAGEHECHELEDDLVTCFERLSVRAGERDKGCVGKAAAVEALVRMGSDRTDVYLRASAHVQHEPVFGGRIDTAGALRGAAIMGLVRSAHPRAYDVLAERLADPEVEARVGAAEAARHGVPHVVSPLLRLRVLTGDPEARVVGACFTALLDVDASDGVAFVARFLDGTPEEVQEAAVLALGESRLHEAFPLLCRWRERAVFRNADRVAFVAMTLLRSEAAEGYLLERIATEDAGVAHVALSALGAASGRLDVRDRIIAAVRRRKRRDLDDALADILRG